MPGSDYDVLVVEARWPTSGGSVGSGWAWTPSPDNMDDFAQVDAGVLPLSEFLTDPNVARAFAEAAQLTGT